MSSETVKEAVNIQVTSIAGSSRLEQLPAEILQFIFDLLHLFEESAQPHLIRPLSKSLAPFSTVTLYRCIQICNDFNLKLLVSTMFNNPSLRELVQYLQLDFDDGNKNEVGNEDERYYFQLLERALQAFLISLNGLKELEVSGCNQAGKLVLSGSLGGFARVGGKELETIRIYNSFDTLSEPVSMAIHHLRHLPKLASIEYCNFDPTDEEEIIFSDIGFYKLTTLRIQMPFPIIHFTTTPKLSFHTTNLVSLFPAVVNLHLIQTDNEEAPDFSLVLSAIEPHCISDLRLSTWAEDLDDIESHPIDHLLHRFISLSKLLFLDGRIFDQDLIEALYKIDSLVLLYIDRCCKISPDLLHRLISGIKKKASMADFALKVNLPMEVGKVGLSTEDGAELVLENGVLVPGADWKRPEWKEGVMTMEEARRLYHLSTDKNINLCGTVFTAMMNEIYFELEEEWLMDAMDVSRIGRKVAVEWREETDIEDAL